MKSKEPGLQQTTVLPLAANGQHLCVDCRADISHLRSIAQRCETCRVIHARQLARNHYWANRSEKLEYMKKRGQDPAARQIQRNWRERNRDKLNLQKKENHRAKTGYNPEGRTCEKCGADISDRGHQAKWCVPCRPRPAPRECAFCHASISHRGARAKFCGEECKRLYHRSKELPGNTKVCTKCNETKEHTEFGFHNDLRRPTCKVCEVKIQSEHYYNFTPEQRERRLHVRREREEVVRTNQSPEEKVLLRAKDRKARLRNRYGPEFDLDRLHEEQNGRCAICRTPKSLEELEVDHADLEDGTKKVRGLLCKKCNFKLLPRYERFPEHLQDSLRLNAYLARGKPQ